MQKETIRKSSPQHPSSKLCPPNDRAFDDESFRTLVQDLRVCVVLIGLHGEIQFANQAALDAFRMTKEQVLGKTTEELGLNVIHEDGSEYPMSMRPGARAIRSQGPVRDEVWGLRRSDSNEVVWLYGAAVPQFDRGGSLRRVVVTATDITERRKSDAALQAANELNRQILLSAQEGIVVHDRSLRYLLWNPFMERTTGMKQKDVLGKHPLELFPFLADSEIHACLEKALRGETASLLDVPYTIPQTGQKGWSNYNFAPLRGEKDEIVGVLGTATDVSERKKRESRLQESEALLAQAEELANMGSWELDVETQMLTWSAQFYRMLGLEPESGPVPYARGIEIVHPDDRGRATRDADRMRIRGMPFDNVLRFVRADGSVRIFHSRAIDITDEKGRVVRTRGMSQDITERKQEEEKLRKSEALLSQAEQMTNFGSWEFNLKTGKSTLSKNLLRIYSLASEAEWDREEYWARIHPEDRKRARANVERAIAECTPFEHVLRHRAPDGTYRVHFARAIQIPGPDGRTERSIGVAQDITDQTRKEEELRQLSARLLQLQDEERRRIARDLHDSASQKLLAISLGLLQIGKSTDVRSKRGKQVLTDTRKLVRDLSKEIRSLSYLLHPPLLDELGLASALEEYVKGFSQRSGIDLEFEMPADIGRLSPESETALFRIVQESLGNIQKHSGSSKGRIRLTKENGEIVLEITDSGRGVRAGHQHERHVSPGKLGVGILGMRERMRQLGGRLDISSESRGTTVMATLSLGVNFANTDANHHGG
jgi:PAS domain S-box-containing protein